jgi:hypothetical protein
VNEVRGLCFGLDREEEEMTEETFLSRDSMSVGQEGEREVAAAVGGGKKVGQGRAWGVRGGGKNHTTFCEIQLHRMCRKKIHAQN